MHTTPTDTTIKDIYSRPGPAYSISLLQQGDPETLEQIVAINDIFADESAHYSDMAYNRDKFRATLAVFAMPGYGCVVAKDHDEVVGYAPYMLDTQYLDKINFEIMTLYVAPEHRNSGVGSLMVDRLMELISITGAGYAQIAICAQFKEHGDIIQRATERLFKRRGFEQIGTVLGKKGE